MILYRVLQNLDTGHKVGDIVDGDGFVHLEILVKRGVLARALLPPLIELPGWKTRCKKLAEIGVETVQDLLDMDPLVGTQLFDHKRESTFTSWIEEAMCWLLAPTPEPG